MRPGNLTRTAGKVLVSSLLAGLLALALAAPSDAAPKWGKKASSTSIETLATTGAAAADGPTVFTISGTDFAGRISTYVGPAGRLTLVSPEGIMAPATPRGECTQDSTTQVSCLAGYIDAVSGDLKGGADTFTAAPEVEILIGVSVPGAMAPLFGNAGRDTITGGALSDYLDGGAGADRLEGNASSDLLQGGSGRDTLRGGTEADALFGAGGNDTFDGGPGRDLCSGGSGRDKAADCFVKKKIP